MESWAKVLFLDAYPDLGVGQTPRPPVGAQPFSLSVFTTLLLFVNGMLNVSFHFHINPIGSRFFAQWNYARVDFCRSPKWGFQFRLHNNRIGKLFLTENIPMWTVFKMKIDKNWQEFDFLRWIGWNFNSTKIRLFHREPIYWNRVFDFPTCGNFDIWSQRMGVMPCLRVITAIVKTVLGKIVFDFSAFQTMARVVPDRVPRGERDNGCRSRLGCHIQPTCSYRSRCQEGRGGGFSGSCELRWKKFECFQIILIREAKKSGLPVTCEVSPHHLFLTEDSLSSQALKEVRPILATEDDQKALWDNMDYIDCFATDHGTLQ